MKENAIKKCINPKCGKTFNIISEAYSCSCNSLLDVIYLDKPEKELIEIFYSRRNHGGNIYNESGVWRFRDLINFLGIDTEDLNECAKILVSLDGAEGRLSKPYRMSKVAEYVGLKQDCLLLQPEGYNPSGSFKDNGMSTAITHAKATGVHKIICASTGNTSASAAMYAANENMRCEVYIPKGEIAAGKLGQAFQFGAQVIQVNGNFDDALNQSLAKVNLQNGYTVNSVNPFRLEGQKTIVYRILENLDWNPPDWLVYPGGALGNTASCGKCLMELYDWGWIKKVPRLVIVNSTGANTFYELVNGEFEGQKLVWNGGNFNTNLLDRYYDFKDSNAILPKTRATAIQIGKPANIAKALRAIEFTDGLVAQVDDGEMSHGMAVVGLNGFDCEMASGAVPAGIKVLREREVIKNDDIVVGVLTGRQKDPALAVEYHTDPKNIFSRPPIV
ncbi:MAG TPA: pyridoxal-phosphate dependent enzyme [Nitrososphaeraceae archaeon]|nr:pyridoxal-phosphate dependent enzyme [Nitrososphaeraceae archaeon]